MRILIFDVETTPALVYTWGLHNQYITIDRIVEPSSMLSWGAKWRGDKKVEYRDVRDDDHIPKLHELMTEADVLVHFNGDSFDVPTVNREFIMAGLTPPAPSKSIDLYKVVRKQFRFQSNKLAFVTQQLGIATKMDSGGFDTWLGCMNNDEKAFARLKKYNKQDVIATEALLDVCEPWVLSPPNAQLYVDDANALCPRCGSEDLTKQGFAYTTAGKFQRFQCGSCGGWSRSNRRLQGASLLEVR